MKETRGKSQIEYWVWVFSVLFVFAVYLENSPRITFPASGEGPLSGPRGVRMGGGLVPGP